MGDSPVETIQRPRAQRAKRRHALPHSYDRAPLAPPAESCPDAFAMEPQAFFASAIHDLKAPLTGIALWVDTLEVLEPRLTASGGPETLALLDQALEQMQTLVSRSIHLVDDVMDILRLQAGRPSPFTPGEVDLVALVREALGGWR
jgi:signal transduction histidine kinase